MQRSYVKLELPKILEMLSRFCTTPLSRELVDGLTPQTELAILQNWQAETTEAREILRFFPTIPLGGIRDVRQALHRAELGAILEPSDLLAICDTVKAGRRLRRFCLEMKRPFPIVQALANQIGVFSELETMIEAAIDDEANVRDDASPELFRLRRKIAATHEKIKAKLEAVLRSQETQKYLQDNLITIRGDRYVIPVKQEYRSQIPGLVHDQSASGATLFIEPLAVVELNNELRTVISAEKNEIERILQNLSKNVQVYAKEITETLQKLAYLDFVFAKGRLSEKMDASEPELNTEGKIKLIRARHPLIQGEVVPTSLELGYEFNTLVITGPNTGGKTVTLKTVGLFSLMAQVGLHIPAEPGSVTAIFQKIFADIGDEQSIEQSLSTFSSHLKNIIEIVKQVNSSSLVLLDELGAGTDPTEGSALAMAILEFLHKNGAKTIATTHYSELKAFAYSTPGIKNASVEFDAETLRPTYKLIIGLPGRSNAMEIALRLGLPADLVRRARSFISKEELQVADMIQDLEENRRASHAEREEIERLKQEIVLLKQALEEERQELKIKEAKILEKAYLEAEEIIAKSRHQAEEIIKSLRTELTAEARRAQEQIAQAAKQQLKNAAEELGQKVKKLNVTPGKPPEYLQPGDQVFITTLQQKGVVLTPLNAQGEVQVQAGILKINVSLKHLRKIEKEATASEKSGVVQLMKDKSLQISNELDLRGLLVEEALEKVDKYLDDAVLANLPNVYLIHGKGTGALRSAIKEHLLRHPHVKNFRIGDYSEGGTGVTVVQLKG
ncbi:endonuclease MutS2 [Zhaonella formicivorans]|uniref:endonuclease MutS2 n=1 Tax=Zhaonella formicivorans TaxID=2528593 RepID=UPI0010D6A7A3|nr:endonuclease MutS2 [Zhaonella formicivorans]